ncbi:PAS domain S-box protein [Gemmata sp. G18]|uniref:histidine kinase n=1 Tax=Gemmata palustris TaxID=2822762 RepID=A0ABS5BV17_9BACT|nr:PAS domain S-box protein [Gemmata palustris]MBP3956743.1 PAS domain S-box protein [Gemmata palustris]
MPFRRIFLLFTAFILVCGTTHLMEAVIFWWPAYRLAGLLKFVTAVISWVTVLALVKGTPQMLAMPTPEELEREVAARRAAEAALVRANAALEGRVRDRTEELTCVNAALRAERERFRTTLSSIGDAVIATDTAGRITFLNPVAEALTGWSAEGAAGADLRSVFHIVNETTRSEVENPAVRALRDGVLVGLANHTVLIARDGRELPIDDCAAPIRDEEGRVAGAVLVFRDITERQRAEAQMRDSEERYRHLFEANPHPMWVFDRETLRFLAVNDAAVAKYGYDRDEFLGLTIKDIRPREDVPALLASLAADTSGLDEAGVWRHRLRHGRVIRVRIVSHTLTFAGRPAEVVLAQDVTDQLRAEEELRASEERFRAFMDHSPAAAWVTDREGHMVYLSASYQRTFRLPPGEIVGRLVWDLYPPDVAAVYLRNILTVADSGTVLTVTEPGVRADGSAGEFLVYKFPLPGPDGSRQVGGVAVDVTEHRAASAALRASEERLVLALSAGGMGTFDWDVASGQVIWSRSHYELFGYAPDDSFTVELRHFKDRIHPDDLPGVEEALRQTMSAGTGYSHEHRVRRPDGTERWVAATGRFRYDPAGRAVRMVGVVQDISSRKRAETERAELLARLNLQIERLPLAYLLSGPDFRYTRWNPAAERIFGFAQSEVLGRHPFEAIVPESSRSLVADVFARLAGGDMNANGSCENVTGDGRTIVCEWHNTPLFAPDGAFQGILSLAQDVTARQRAELELRLRDRAIRAVRQGIVITDAARADNPIIYTSPGFEWLTGYAGTEVAGRNCRFLQGPGTDQEALILLREAVRDARPCDVELLNYRKDGTPFWNHLQLSPVRDDAGRLTHYIGVQADVSGRRKLEDQVRQAHKLEAVGQLAGGVAHDFNNLLTVVNGCGELLLLELAADAPTRPLVEDIVRAGARGASLTRQLLAFGRQQMLRVEVFDLNQVLQDTAKLLTRLLGEDIALRTVLGPESGLVKGDVGQVEQVVINLAVNGRDAMPRGGTLVIETAPADVTDATLPDSPDARPGRYVRLSVTDTGTGMGPDVQARLFEPFFTTKDIGKGTGLGLAMVYGIVSQSGGFLTVLSEIGRGTTIAVYLPRYEDKPSEEPKSALRPAPRPTGSETILVVEDDEAVRALTTTVLVRQGYRVEAAESGTAALATCARLPVPPDLVLTDVVMPGMSGRELAEVLTVQFPRIKVVFLSGYTADAVLRHGVEEKQVAFLQKPYTPDALARFVRGVLDRKSGDSV